MECIVSVDRNFLYSYVFMYIGMYYMCWYGLIRIVCNGQHWYVLCICICTVHIVCIVCIDRYLRVLECITYISLFWYVLHEMCVFVCICMYCTWCVFMCIGMHYIYWHILACNEMYCTKWWVLIGPRLCLCVLVCTNVYWYELAWLYL